MKGCTYSTYQRITLSFDIFYSKTINQHKLQCCNPYEGSNVCIYLLVIEYVCKDYMLDKLGVFLYGRYICLEPSSHTTLEESYKGLNDTLLPNLPLSKPSKSLDHLFALAKHVKQNLIIMIGNIEDC